MLKHRGGCAFSTSQQYLDPQQQDTAATGNQLESCFEKDSHLLHRRGSPMPTISVAPRPLTCGLQRMHPPAAMTRSASAGSFTM
eukprot:1567901-Amphidinium_carterae.2